MGKGRIFCDCANLTKNIYLEMKNKKMIKEGDKIIFTSGNFQGMTAVVNKINFNSINPKANYGFYHEVVLSNGNIGYIEKAEHWEFI